jgi:hypothetical protein
LKDILVIPSFTQPRAEVAILLLVTGGLNRFTVSFEIKTVMNFYRVIFWSLAFVVKHI